MLDVQIRPRRRDPREVMRDEMVQRDRILMVLRDGPHTVPQIAEAIGAPSHETMQWVMAAWRYGYVAAAGTDPDDLCLYDLADKERP